LTASSSRSTATAGPTSRDFAGASSTATPRSRSSTWIFDVLTIEGDDVKACPYYERRELLDELELLGSH
jgi:ATP-dependent DNA ligase